MNPSVIQVIQSQVKRGSGTDLNPLRIVTQYHAFDGTFLAELDPQLEADREELRQKVGVPHSAHDPLRVAIGEYVSILERR